MKSYFRAAIIIFASMPQQERWFFVTPQVCWDRHLLHWCLLLAARGGITWTALYVIYSTLWGHTLQGSQYATRQHFVAAVELAAWASVPAFLCAVFNLFCACYSCSWFAF